MERVWRLRRKKKKTLRCRKLAQKGPEKKKTASTKNCEKRVVPGLWVGGNWEKTAE